MYSLEENLRISNCLLQAVLLEAGHTYAWKETHRQRGPSISSRENAKEHDDQPSKVRRKSNHAGLEFFKELLTAIRRSYIAVILYIFIYLHTVNKYLLNGSTNE